MAFNQTYYNRIMNDRFSNIDRAKEFESKFEARIEDSKEYKQYVRTSPYSVSDMRSLYEPELRVVPMKSIHMTSDSLAKLIAEQQLIDRLLQDAEAGKRMWLKEREDRIVRDTNPAVAKAYKNYIMLLELARN